MPLTDNWGDRQGSLEKSAINAYGKVSDFAKEAKIDRTHVIGLKTLKKHRHVQAHIYQEKRSHEDVQEFVDTDQHYLDDIALRVWSVRSSIIQLMIKNGIEVKNPQRITHTPELVDIIYNIFRYCCKDMGQLTPTHIQAILNMFSATLMAKYAETFQEEFKSIFSEGPFII